MEEIVSEGLRLSAHFARPPGLTRVPALLVLPGFPRGASGAASLGNTDASLCDRVARGDVSGVWIAGFRLGGTLAIVTAAGDERVLGIATFAAPASLRKWVREPD